MEQGCWDGVFVKRPGGMLCIIKSKKMVGVEKWDGHHHPEIYHHDCQDATWSTAVPGNIAGRNNSNSNDVVGGKQENEITAYLVR